MLLCKKKEVSDLHIRIEYLRQKIINREYLLSSHAEDEMVNDMLDRMDIEHAILHGFIEKQLTHDFRGARYRIEGSSRDNRLIHVICRFKVGRNLLIITAYALFE